MTLPKILGLIPLVTPLWPANQKSLSNYYKVYSQVFPFSFGHPLYSQIVIEQTKKQFYFGKISQIETYKEWKYEIYLIFIKL